MILDGDSILTVLVTRRRAADSHGLGETDDQGRHRYTVTQIAAEFEVTRPTAYRYLDPDSPPTATFTERPASETGSGPLI